MDETLNEKIQTYVIDAPIVDAPKKQPEIEISDDDDEEEDEKKENSKPLPKKNEDKIKYVLKNFKEDLISDVAMYIDNNLEKKSLTKKISLVVLPITIIWIFLTAIFNFCWIGFGYLFKNQIGVIIISNSIGMVSFILLIVIVYFLMKYRYKKNEKMQFTRI